MNRWRSGYSVRYCEEPFTNAHHRMNPELVQPNNEGEAIRRGFKCLIQSHAGALTRRASWSSLPSSPPLQDPRGSYDTSSTKGRALDNPPSFDGRCERRDHRLTRINPSDRDSNPNARHPGTFTTDPENLPPFRRPTPSVIPDLVFSVGFHA